MQFKNIGLLLIILVLLIISPVNAYPYFINITAVPIPATYNQTAGIAFTANMAGVDLVNDSCQRTNLASLTRYWWTDSNGKALVEITGARGLTSGNIFPPPYGFNATASGTTGFRIIGTTAGTFMGQCYSNSWFQPLNQTVPTGIVGYDGDLSSGDTFNNAYHADWDFANYFVPVANLNFNVEQKGVPSNKITNATVQYSNLDGTGYIGMTDPSGNVTFNNVQGSYQERDLNAGAIGYNSYYEAFIFDGTNTFHQIDMDLTNQPTSNNIINVNVRDGVTGNYITNTPYGIYDFNHSAWRNGTLPTGAGFFQDTGANHEYPLVYNDMYKVAVSPAGYKANASTFAYNQSGQTIDFYLTPSGAFSNINHLDVDIVDASTGATIGGSSVGLKEFITGEWQNKTSSTGATFYDTAGTFGEYPITLGNYYTVSAVASGYLPNTISNVQFINPTLIAHGDHVADGFKHVYVAIPLVQSGTIPSGNCSESVYTYDGITNTPLGGVGVLMNNGQGQTTASNGITAFILPAGNYNYRASITGYQQAAGTFNCVNGSNSQLNIPLISGQTTLTPTPSVSPTIIGAQNLTNHTGVCYVNGQYPANMTLLDQLYSQMACWGFKGQVEQNAMFGFLIIILAALILGKYGKGIGILAGAIIGSVIDIYMGILPFWVAILMVVICGIVAARMIVGNSK